MYYPERPYNIMVQTEGAGPNLALLQTFPPHVILTSTLKGFISFSKKSHEVFYDFSKASQRAVERTPGSARSTAGSTPAEHRPPPALAGSRARTPQLGRPSAERGSALAAGGGGLGEAAQPAARPAGGEKDVRREAVPVQGRVPRRPGSAQRLDARRGVPATGLGTHATLTCSTEKGVTMPGKEKRGTGRGKSHGKKQKKPEVDILSPAAMLNLYYIAHNVADCLQLRGFRWPGAPKAKKGKAKT
nr:small lysine-rich protein 1 [Equus caballus]